MSFTKHFQLFPTLALLVQQAERRRILALLFLTILMAVFELILALLVALLAKVISGGSLDHNVDTLTTLQSSSEWIFGQHSHTLILGSLLTLLLTLLSRSTMQLLYQWQLTQCAERIGAHNRIRIFQLYQQAPYLWISYEGIAELQFSIGASHSVSIAIAHILHLGAHLLMVAMLMIGLACFAPMLTVLVLFTLSILGAILLIIVKRRLQHYSDTVLDQELNLAQLTYHALHGLKEIRLTRRQHILLDHHQQGLDQLIHAKTKQQLLSLLPTASLEFLGFTALFLVATYLVYIEDMRTSDLSMILGLITAVAWRGLPMINRILNGYNTLSKHQPYLERVIKMINLEEKLIDAPHSEYTPSTPKTLSSNLQSVAKETLTFEQLLSVKNVFFRYPNAKEWVLNDLNFSIKTGESLAIVGQSGAGKSTLAHCLVGLFLPDQGSITIDGYSLGPIHLNSWLSQIGYVSQKPYIFDLSLAENIALADYGETLDYDRIRVCCELAMVDFIEDLDLGLDSPIGEDGMTLSGGQAQRVALARALYHQPRVLILDEATNALDTQYEQEMMTKLRDLRPSLTLIIISHHLQGLEHCDHLIWLEQGRIHQQGTAAEILTHYRHFLS